MTQQLYYWTSEMLAGVRWGAIVVVASDIEEARALARAQFEPTLIREREWLYPETWGGTPDESDLEERIELTAKLEADIMKEPKVLQTLFLCGAT